MSQSNSITYEERSLFGFWLYILSDCVLFAGLFATFAVLRGETYGGATNEQLLNLPFLFAETVILLASSYAMGFALVGLQAGQAPNGGKTWPSGPEHTRAVLVPLAASLLLGLTFLGLEIYEFHGLVAAGNGPGRSAFLSAFFTLVGTHGLHVFLGALWMAVLMFFIRRRGLTPGNARKLRMLALFWHFLDLIWIFIFSIVYLLSTAL